MKKTLKVMIDVSAVPYNRGVSRYTSNLVQELASRSDVKLSVFGYSQGRFQQLKKWSEILPKEVRRYWWRLPPNLVGKGWRRFGWPKPPLKGIDVYHAWDWQLAPLKNFPQVVTIHDLAYKFFPETAHPSVVEHYDYLLEQLEKRSQIRVIAVSHATKNDILKLTNISADRIHVIYQALPEESMLVPNKEEIDSYLRSIGLVKPYLLFVGTTEPRKNLARIIQAWESLRDKYDLVIAGSAGWDKFEVKEGMHILGYVEPLDLAALYRQAKALLFPSLYEGFGFPILEAYYHGCPVITSNNSSMSEIGGRPAVLVDPTKAEEIRDAVLALEEKNSRAGRQRQRDMAEVVSRFTWRETAARTVDVYQLAKSET